MIRRPLKPSWIAFHSMSAALNRPGTGTSWKTLPFPLIRRAGAHLLDFPQPRRQFTQLELFCNNRSYCTKWIRGRCRRIRSSIRRQQSCAPGCLPGQTQSAGQPLSITAPRSSFARWKSPGGPLCSRHPHVHPYAHGFIAATNITLAGKVTVPAARLTVTLPSSSGCRNTSRVERLNSGSSSRKSTPLCARLTSPGARIRRAPDQPHVGNCMMRSAEGPVRAEGVGALVEQSANDTVNFGGLHRLLR